MIPPNNYIAPYQAARGADPQAHCWWLDLELSERARTALKMVDGIDSPKFKNDSPADFKVILRHKRLFKLRNIGQATHEELCRLMKVKP